MENTNFSDELEFKIGIVGPSRVGKTTLLTSILENAHELLSGKAVVFDAEDDRTRMIVSDSNDKLDGSLYAGEFDVGALGGTQEASELNFVLSHSNFNDVQLKVRFLDFPGGWLDEVPSGKKEEWEKCQKWIRDSQILLVPVDASVLMEASNANHVKSIPSILSLNNVKEVIRRWAKVRNEKHGYVSGALLLCPLKCETYFDDNGGRKNDSEKLFLCVKKFYGDIISEAKKEYPQLEVIYSPIDSIGCVEILDGKWGKVEGDGLYQFTPSFRVRNQASKRSVKGADAILINVFKGILATSRKIKQIFEAKANGKLQESIALLEKDEGFVGNFWNWLSGETEKRKKQSGEDEKAYQEKLNARKAVDEIIDAVGEKQPSRQINRFF